MSADRFPEPLEKRGMPPAPLGTYRLESSPRMISQFGVFTSYQVNVDAQGNNIVGDAANEPSISVDPTDGNKVAIGWRQFDTINSDFRQVGYRYSTDAGITWHFPGTLQPGVFRSDPVTNSDDTGTLFYLSLLVNTFCGDIWRSTNGGETWTEQSPDGGAHSGDKEWFTVDRTPTSMGHGFQYHFWTEFAACDFGGFSRSTDGGATWRLRSAFLTHLSGERLMWPAMAIFLLAAGIRAAVFGAFDRPTRKTRLSRRRLTRLRQSTWAAAWLSVAR
jgi:hypothetical protein